MNSIAEISSRAFEQLARDGLEPTPPNYSRAFAAAAADAGVIASALPRGTRSSAVREMADDLRAIADQCIKAAARLHGTLASGKATLKQQLEAAIESSESSTLSVVRASGSNVGNVIGAVAAVSAEKMACAALRCTAGRCRWDMHARKCRPRPNSAAISCRVPMRCRCCVAIWPARDDARSRSASR